MGILSFYCAVGSHFLNTSYEIHTSHISLAITLPSSSLIALPCLEPTFTGRASWHSPGSFRAVTCRFYPHCACKHWHSCGFWRSGRIIIMVDPNIHHKLKNHILFLINELTLLSAENQIFTWNIHFAARGGWTTRPPPPNPSPSVQTINLVPFTTCPGFCLALHRVKRDDTVL
jgi:hypothetical protein